MSCEHRNWYTTLGRTFCMNCRSELPQPPPASSAASPAGKVINVDFTKKRWS